MCVCVLIFFLKFYLQAFFVIEMCRSFEGFAVMVGAWSIVVVCRRLLMLLGYGVDIGVFVCGLLLFLLALVVIEICGFF